MHKCAIGLKIGVCNFVRVQETPGSTPAVAAGIEGKWWSLERVVEVAEVKREPKDAEFEKALAQTALKIAPG